MTQKEFDLKVLALVKRMANEAISYPEVANKRDTYEERSHKAYERDDYDNGQKYADLAEIYSDACKVYEVLHRDEFSEFNQ